MALPQLSYAEMAAGYAGMKADSSDDQCDSYVQGEVSAEMPFGIMAFQGTVSTVAGTPNKAILATSVSSVLAGVVLHAHNYDRRTEMGTVGLLPKTMLSLMRRGRVWVVVEEAVTANAIPFVRHTANGAGKLVVGAFRSDIDTDKAIKCRGCRFVTSTAAAGIAIVEVDILAAESFRGVTGY